MKRTATEWANLMDCSAESSSVLLDKEDATDLAVLLRAMVAEREALQAFADAAYRREDTVFHSRDADKATAARRRAEGVET
jgi:GAF domain-containing protein